MGTVAQGNNSGSSFWSNLVDTASSTIQQVAPRWAEKQLGIQQTSQINQDTRSTKNLPHNLNGIGGQTSQVISRSPMAALALIGGGVLLVIMIMKAKQ